MLNSKGLPGFKLAPEGKRLGVRKFAPPLARLIDELGKLPGVGPKSAQRLAFHIISAPRGQVAALASALLAAKDELRECAICFNLTQEETCEICRSPARDRERLCVVATVRDLLALEATGGYKGLYHVLGGVLSPLAGKGPEDLHVEALLERLQAGEIKEVILALNPDVEGEATALYLADQIRPLGVRVTKLALGLPVGGELDYADEVTLIRALEGRQQL